MVVAVTVGMTLGSFSPTQPAIALQLEAITTIPPDSTPLEWKQEGRAGASEATDYEFAIGLSQAQVDEIFSQSVAPNNGVDLDKFAWASDTLISSLTGTARISWNTLNPNQAQARSRLDFQIVGYNINSAPDTSIPEPSSALVFLTRETSREQASPF